MGFFRWHQGKTERVQKWLGISHYQLMWWAWVKGLITGALIIYFCMK